MTQVSNWIDIIEDIEEDPEAAQILSSYEGVFSGKLVAHSRFDVIRCRCMQDLRTYVGHPRGQRAFSRC